MEEDSPVLPSSSAIRSDSRVLGLFGATIMGVGAIVGGGILALAGVAFAATGPAAMPAFALNGLIALLTALSFAEMSTRFPESGGAYTFARKVMSVNSAFMVGWIVWFASIVASVLYARGFAAFFLLMLENGWRALVGTAPAWLHHPGLTVLLALGAATWFGFRLTRGDAGGGAWINIAKVLVFGTVIAFGLFFVCRTGWSAAGARLSPFFTCGAPGLLQAMGFTFIALQGFDLIAAAAGEIREPQRVIPHAMFMSLGMALLIYLPLLLVLAVLGAPEGVAIDVYAQDHKVSLVPLAVQRFLGGPGFWLVAVAGLLSMLSALQANLYASSRVAFSMARDRTLPTAVSFLGEHSGAPIMAVLLSSLAVVILLLLLPDVAAAGAASSLIFLLTFALVHGVTVLVRHRAGSRRGAFKVPLFPLPQLLGAAACLGLGLFQGIAAPQAGLVVLGWLTLGALVYRSLLAHRARIFDAASEGHDLQLERLRGHNPLVLAPLVNPAHVGSMVMLANAMAPPEIGRVLLLSVVTPAASDKNTGQRLENAQAVLREALTASLKAGIAPEALVTIASQPWNEIARVVRMHRCESLLLGFSSGVDTLNHKDLEALLSRVDCHAAVLKAAPGWDIARVRRVLIPVGGRSSHDELRARLIGRLCLGCRREITYLRILPETASARAYEQARQTAHQLARDEACQAFDLKIVRAAAPELEIMAHGAQSDLIIMGLQRVSRKHKIFGHIALAIARQAPCPVLMISRGR